jgi:hypothetical protein
VDDFDKQFKVMTNAIFAAWIFVGVFSVVSFTFTVFVIVKLMQYFGVL